MTTSLQPAIVLASQSRYKKALLARLLSGFTTFDPAIDEAPAARETARDLAIRLAASKARATGKPAENLTVGADQVAELDGELLGKPLSRTRNIEMLSQCQGRQVVFHTAVCVDSAGGELQSFCDETRVRFRSLSRSQIERYVDFDKAMDCAGGFRIESAAPVLIAAVETNDPTALMGLPLIWLADTLQNAGIALPA